MHPNLDRQLDLEREMSALGHQRYVESVVTGTEIPDLRNVGQMRHKKSHREAETESMTAYGRSLITHSIDLIGQGLHTLMAEQVAGRGRQPRWWEMLHQLYPVSVPIARRVADTDAQHQARMVRAEAHYIEGQKQSMRVAAFIGIRTVVDCLTTHVREATVANRIGGGIESELKFRHFKRTNPALFEKVFRDTKKREPNMDRREAILKHAMRHDDTGKASTWQAWSTEDKMRIGGVVLNVIYRSTDIVKVDTLHSGRGVGKANKVNMLSPTDTTLKLMDDREIRSGVCFPVFLPAVCPPKEWESPLAGAYYSAFEALAPVRMIKTPMRPSGALYLKEMHARRQEMPLVYRAINGVQNTAWRINKPLHDVMRHAWEKTSLGIGKLPVRTDMATLHEHFPLEPYDESLKDDPEKYLKWKRRRNKIYKARVVQMSHVLQSGRMMILADKFRDEAEIYFPMQLDFRARMYAMPSFLSPQGTDCAKGLLTFAKGCRLGASGWKWLHIHVASMAGEDKIGFDEREAWTVSNYHWIVDCVKQPFEHRRWMEMDKPWQFLAGAIELVAAVESGDYENYVSSLPVTVDGTCNGLQHFSAMLLDTAGAISVNLAPSDKPNDIYQIVADKVAAKFKTLDDPLAQAWLSWGFDRKATKRAVMILPYSGTLHAAKDYILEYVTERAEKDPTPWEDDFAASRFFATHVWDEIGKTIKSAGLVMSWLKLVAEAVTKAGLPLRWRTPLNFLVEQDNRKTSTHRVELAIGCGMRFQPFVREDTEELDGKAQKLGVSPNFIHSLDAVCLMLTVNRALDEGITSFALVHDSYGVVAGQMDTLFVGLRQAFVDIYQTDVMREFAVYATKDLAPEVQQQLLAAMPTKGTFNLESVKDSKYFFA